ncbi:MAG: hypothetical protein AABY16_02610, partial [Nanoarchaeota archaeon]
MQHKKGQAAMEFLMTYGWAILAAIVAIGVLAYFGVFSPGRITGNTVVINNPFYASASQIRVSTSDINIELTNNGGSDLAISSMTVTGVGAFSSVTCANNAISTVFNPGLNTIVTLPCVGTLTVGEIFAGDTI